MSAIPYHWRQCPNWIYRRDDSFEIIATDPTYWWARDKHKKVVTNGGFRLLWGSLLEAYTYIDEHYPMPEGQLDPEDVVEAAYGDSGPCLSVEDAQILHVTRAKVKFSDLAHVRIDANRNMDFYAEGKTFIEAMEKYKYSFEQWVESDRSGHHGDMA